MTSSLPYPLSPPDSLLRSQSDSDSLPSYSYPHLDSAPNSLTDSLPLPSLTSPSRREVAASSLSARSSQHGSSNIVDNPLPNDQHKQRSLTGSGEMGVANTSTSTVTTGDDSRDKTSNTTDVQSNSVTPVTIWSSKESTPSNTLSPPRENNDTAKGATLPDDAHLKPNGDTKVVMDKFPAKKGEEVHAKTDGKNLPLPEDSSNGAVGKKTRFKPSSRGGSGASTPKTLRHSNKKEGSNDKLNVSSASPLASTTPPRGAPKKPPDTLPEDIKKKLEELGKELPSPLYGRQYSNPSNGAAENTASIRSTSGEQIDGGSQARGIYDRQDSTEVKLVQDAVQASGLIKQRSRRLPRRSTSDAIITKPGLDSNSVAKFFKKIVAEDSTEVLMNLTWGVANFSSAPLCELEVGVMTSDRAIYVMEVLDPERHLTHPLSWSTENLPLGRVLKILHTEVRRLNIGIFDQSVYIEAHCKAVKKKFVFLPHTQEKVNLFVENLKAAFDATGLQYSYGSSKDSFVSSSGSKEEMVLRNPGALDMASLKDDLVWSRSLVQVGNFIASNSKSDTSQLTISFESEMKRMSSVMSAKFEIVQYVIVGELSADVLPISQGGVHVCSRALIVTNTAIYLCKEELDSWPHTTTAIKPPPFPRCAVLDSHPVSRVAGIRVCDKSHPVVSNSDPLYEFSISFKEMDDVNVSPLWVSEWKLCVHDRQYLDQLLECLLHLANDFHKDKPLVIKHIASKISSPSTPKMPSSQSHDSADPRKIGEVVSKKNYVNSSRGSSPCFFTSIDLFEFSTSTNYQRKKFFKKHVAQAEFLKSDEVPLSIFLAHCSSYQSDYVEIEACVIVSNYAVYLISDVDNIEQWLNSGGEFSFQRRDLLNRGDSNHIRCFYRLWLSDILEVKVGLYYMSLAVTDTNSPEKPRFIIHTENPSSTISFLNAAACVVNFHDKEEEKQMDDLLSQYDLMDDSPKEEEMMRKKKNKKETENHQVEFVYRAEEGLDVLKRAMVQESPGVTKGMSVSTCNKAIKILYQQVVLLVEELRIRDHLCSSFYPHFVFLTNFGMYVCLNGSSGKKSSPAVMHPSDLKVKKWCHIDLLERVQVFSPAAKQYTCYNVVVHLRSASHRSSLSSSDSKMLSFLIQNSELLSTFLYHFSLIYRERCGKQISITWE